MGRKHGRAGAERKLLLGFEAERNKEKPDLTKLLQLQAELKVLGKTVGLSGITEIHLVKDPRHHQVG